MWHPLLICYNTSVTNTYNYDNIKFHHYHHFLNFPITVETFSVNCFKTDSWIVAYMPIGLTLTLSWPVMPFENDLITGKTLNKFDCCLTNHQKAGEENKDWVCPHGEHASWCTG